MAALDTFEWFVASHMKRQGGELDEFIRKERDYLFSLRSEDERQRAVNAAIVTMNEIIRSMKKN